MKYNITKYCFILSLCMALFSTVSFAQIGTSQSLQLDDSVMVVRVADIDSFVYDATNLTNLTSLNLDVSYRMQPISPARYPAAWRNEIEYPNLFHYTNQQTGSFKLYGQIGHDTLRVVFYPTDTPTDTVELYFVATAYTFVVVDEVEKVKTALQIWPNPTADVLNIQAEISGDLAEKLNICVFDQLGRRQLFYQTTAANLGEGINIDSSPLAAGVYYLQVRNQDNHKGNNIIEHKIFIKI